MFDEKLFAIKKLGLENQENKEWVYTVLDDVGFDLIETVNSDEENEVVLKTTDDGIRMVMDTKDPYLLHPVCNGNRYSIDQYKKYISIRVISEKDKKLEGRLTLKFIDKEYKISEIDGYLLYNNGTDREMHVFSGQAEQTSVALYDSNSLNAYEIIAKKPILETETGYKKFEEYCIFPEESIHISNPIRAYFKFSDLVADYSNRKIK